MPGRSLHDWTKIRCAYEAGQTPSALARQFGVSPSQIGRRRRREGWTVGPADEVRDVLSRLYAATDRKLRQLEALMTTDEPRSASDHERESRALATLTRNFEKVVALEKDKREGAAGRSANKQPDKPVAGGRGAGRAAGNERDADALRRELAARILKLRERLERDRDGAG